MVNQRPNPFGNHCGTKHKVDKRTGGANRGQGRISNAERMRRVAAEKEKQQRRDEARKIAEEKEKREAAINRRKTQKKYDDYCKHAAKIYESGEGLGNSESYDDDDDADDGDSDADEEEEFDQLSSTQSTTKRTSNTRACYMPQKDSCIWELMNDHQVDMKSMFSRKKSKLWYRGLEDPVAINCHSPQKWYKTRFNVFNWLVFDAFNVDIREIKCIHGCEYIEGGTKQNVKLHSYRWSPMVCIDHIAWVYHQRFAGLWTL